MLSILVTCLLPTDVQGLLLYSVNCAAPLLCYHSAKDFGRLFVGNRCLYRACYYNRILVTCLLPTDVRVGLIIILGFWSPVCRQQMFVQGVLL